MTVFERGHKVNFIDENNVFVGYDMSQCCCEDADWFIPDEILDRVPEVRSKPQEFVGMEGWAFDTRFFHEVPDNPGVYDGGGMVVFRMINGDREQFLHLYNIHNGYYGHGFEFLKDGETIREGCL